MLEKNGTFPERGSQSARLRSRRSVVTPQERTDKRLRNDFGGNILALPPLETLHERCNLSRALLASWAEAASVVLSRFAASPVPLNIGGDPDAMRLLTFPKPSAKEHASYANRPDATEMGAYATALAVVEHFYSLYAVQRARELSGSDIIVSPTPQNDLLEDAWRLEVSGTLGNELDVRARFKAKCDQLLSGNSEMDGIVCVVGFRARLIIVERIVL